VGRVPITLAIYILEVITNVADPVWTACIPN
jgi:hypothetical protein